MTTDAPARPDQPPVTTGDPVADARALARATTAAGHRLAELGPRPQRDATRQAEADLIHRRCRAARTAFLAAHAVHVYRRATGSLPDRFRLGDLAGAVATLFPGLGPDDEQLAADGRRPQADKEGWEIDRGVLFGGLLRVPEVGRDLVRTMLRPTATALELLPAFRSGGRTTTATVTVERRGPRAHLTIHNTRSLNTEDDRLVADLETAIDLALLDPGVRVCVLRGGEMTHPRYRGRRVFSAGIDLKELQAGRISFTDFLLGRELGPVNKIRRGLRLEPADVAVAGLTPADGAFDGGGDPADAAWSVEKPWLAVVDSFAIGGGAQLLLVCDRILAGADAYVSLPAAAEGIVPGLANLRLVRQAGGRLARQMILGGRRLAAHEPEARLILDAVADPGELDAAVEREAALLDTPAVVANRRMLRIAEEPEDLFRAYLAEFAAVQAHRLYAPDVIGKAGRFAASR